MQIKSLRSKSYRSFKSDNTMSADASERLRRIETVQALRAEGFSEATSVVSLVKSRIEALEFDASVVGGEVPVDLGLDPVSGGLPGADFGA